MLDHPRASRPGGGTALVFKDIFVVKKIDGGERKSFEFSEWILQHGSSKLRVIIIYRVPYSVQHPVTTSVFFDEFSSYLESVVMTPEPLLITGDFNIHVDVPSDSDASRLMDLLTSMGLEQHVSNSTHISGHTLDLVVTRCSDSVLAAKPITDHLFSDHITVVCDLTLGKPSPMLKKLSYRKIKAIDREKLRQDLSTSELCQDSPVALNDLVECYNATLTQALDQHAPVRTKVVRSRPLVPWFNEDIRVARREKRKAERKWRRTGSLEDMLNYKSIKNRTNKLMNDARCQFYQDFILENSSNQRRLFAASKELLNLENKNAVFPPFDDKLEFANQMGTFFVQKIANIHTKLDGMSYDEHLHEVSVDVIPDSGTQMRGFAALTELQVRELIAGCSKKSCSLDPMPTSLVLDCIDVLLPVITKMINLSLKSGAFADAWKCALVKPLLKKAGLDLLPKNYRPVSNLQYVSKLTEKAVFSQIHAHMMDNSIYPEMQSSYRQFHSTETALLKVMNDVLMKMNSQEVTLLVMLDLSAAFDTVNHDILIKRLHDDVGICDAALDWFKSYLHNRGQRVCIDGTLSDHFSLNCGVPQGSCLGPLLFVIYASKLFKVIEDHLPDAHCYADDTQLYLSFKPNNTSQEEAVIEMQNCIEKIRQWMIHDRLLINDDKTEFILIGTRQQLSKLQPTNISVGDSVINPSPSVKNLGCWLDSNLSMSEHITNVCKAAFFYLHNIRCIKRYLTKDNLLVLVHAFVTSRIDYCNSLLYGISKDQLSKLQRVQNAAARLIMDVGKYSHITPVLYKLHWLPVEARINFKLLLLTFKAIHGQAPLYIKDLIVIKSQSKYSIRSHKGLLLEPPKGKMLTTLGARSFQFAAPHLWNTLPLCIRSLTRVDIFKKELKTYLFRKVFNC